MKKISTLLQKIIPQFHAQHVLVEKEEDAKKKERLDKGEDIKKIAKEISIDPSAKRKFR